MCRMQLDRPLRVVTPSLDGDVLFALARSEASFTPSEIHRLVADHSESGIRKVLARLVEQGIVTSGRAGNAFVYHLNRDHLAAPAVIELAEQKTELIRRLRHRIATWATPPTYACLFGSAVTGAMRPDSDIDLFVIRPEDAPARGWADHISDLQAATTSWTGNDARTLELSETEAIEGIRARDPVLREIMNRNISLHGDDHDLRSLIRAAS